MKKSKISDKTGAIILLIIFIIINAFSIYGIFTYDSSIDYPRRYETFILIMPTITIIGIVLIIWNKFLLWVYTRKSIKGPKTIPEKESNIVKKPTNKLNLYEQRFSDDLDPIQSIRDVNYDDACLEIDQFYASLFKPGDRMLIGFSKDEYFFELSKDDSGKVVYLRIERDKMNTVDEENPTIETAKVLLKSFYNEVG